MRRISLLLLLILPIAMSAQNDFSISEYANFEMYVADNQRIGTPKSDEKRVVFMGNSITEAWVRYSPDFFTDNNYVGRGISGQVTHQMLLRFRADVLDLKPTAVVILAGTNDIAQNSGPVSLDEIADNIKSMADLALENNIKVILCSVLPAKDYPWKPGMNPLEKIPQLNEMIKGYAQKTRSVYYVDLYESMVDDEGGMKVPRFTRADDLVHPNKAGYEMMEAVLHREIEAALLLAIRRR